MKEDMTFMHMRKIAVASLILAFVVGVFPTIHVAEAAKTSYPHDFELTLPGTGVKLKILAGSEADRVTKGATSVTVEMSAGQTFRLHYPGPDPGKLVNDAGLSDCTIADDGDTELLLVGPATVTVTPVAETCAAPAADGSATSGTTTGTTAIKVHGAARVRLFSPDGGETLAEGDDTLVLWSANVPEGFAKFVLSLSTDDGETYAKIGEKAMNDGFFLWTVPDEPSLFAYLRIEMLDQDGAVLATDVSRDKFVISGPDLEIGGDVIAQFGDLYGSSQADKEAGAGAPVTDPTAVGDYTAESAVEATPTVDVDLHLPTVSDAELYCIPGTAFKGKRDTVYYCARDGKRYVFPNHKIYQTWFDDFSHVITFSDEHIAMIPLGGNVTYKPGARLVKVQTDPKVYAVSRGGTLRHVKDESAAERVFGKDWAQQVDDIPDPLFTDYTIGEDIE